MNISEKDVAHIARLARLFVTPQEVKRYQEQLGKILDSMEELKALDTSKVRPTAHVLGLADVFRADEPRQAVDPETLLAAAPEREGPYFKVRKVIE